MVTAVGLVLAGMLLGVAVVAAVVVGWLFTPDDGVPVRDDDPEAVDVEPGEPGLGGGDGIGSVGDDDDQPSDPPSEQPPAQEPPAAPPASEDARPQPPSELAASDEEPAEQDVFTVEEQQQLLREYGFLIGPVDGELGQQTTAAIMAYQQVNGLAVDGVVGPRTKEALRAGSVEPELAGGPDDRIEVDLDAQLLHLVEDGQRVVTLKVSSGSGEGYETGGGGTARALTPVGRFVIERRIHGVREAPLGRLYDPLYFHRGFAVHGSPSVPAHPASHGCVRISMADAAWLIQQVPDGVPVHLYGGTHVFAV